jgi:diguanylate cyclase (GGDEF)-like protein/PAS domain S-box-containing protein
VPLPLNFQATKMTQATMTNPNVQNRPIFFLKMLGVAVFYALLAYANNFLFEKEGIASIAEPACGLALAALLIGGRQYAWGVFLGSFLINTILDGPSWAAAIIASGNTLEVLAAAWLFTHFSSSDLRLQSLGSYLLLILAGSIGGIICSLIESTTLLGSGMLASGDYVNALAHRWMGDVFGIALITPLIMTWWNKQHTYEKLMEWILEFIPALFLTFMAGQVIFLGWLHSTAGIFELVAKGYWMFLFITWVAVRHGTRGTMIVLNMVAIQALWGAYHEVGFFANDIAQTHLANYWFYMMTLTMVGMALSTYFTERKLREEVLHQSETRLRTLYDSTSDAVMMLDEKGFFDCNRATLEMFGCATKKEFCSKHPADLSPPEQPCGMESRMLADEQIATAMEKGYNRFEWLHRRASNDKDFPAEVLLNSMELDGKKVLQATVRDITGRKQAEEEIKNLAFYDPLTHLPNRRLLMDRLKQALASSARSGREGALLFIDLDNFKTLNDTLGHDIGDLLLQQVAQRLESCIREGDTVARLGGDEFVVMLEDLSEHDLEAATQAETVGEKILATLNQPYQLATHGHHSTPSIGIAIFSDHEQSQDELLKQADIAMYQAKKAGRNALRFFDPQMQDSINARVLMESDLRHAVLDQEQFVLYYQPQVDSTGRVTGAESLVRWLHPKRGLVSPAEFIPLAEETGLILPLGHWVMATACQQLVAWAAQPETAHLILAVNVSAKQFQLPTFVEEVLALVNHFKVDPTKLKLEITESMLLDNVDDIIEKMTTLKTSGITFSMDDFGTGYSSLSSLKRLPLNQLKIDQSFVRDITADESGKAIVRTIIAMAQNLGMNVIAEGVEMKAQQELLMEKGCAAYQGYLFGKPVPIEQFDALLKQC